MPAVVPDLDRLSERRGDQRHLKSRASDEGRTVPCPPELTPLLWEHIERYGYGPDGRVFHGEKGGDVPMITYTRIWRAARKLALRLAGPVRTKNHR